MAQQFQPVGPWQCITCGRELLLIVDADSPPGISETVRDQCGTDHFVPGRLIGFYWRNEEDKNWEEVPAGQPTLDERIREGAA